MIRCTKNRIKVREALRHLTGYVASGAVLITQMVPAYADIVPEPDGSGGTTTATVVAAGGDITTGTQRDGVGFNVFSEFQVDSTQSYNLIQPSGSTALVNIVRGTTASTVAGTLDISHADAGETSNVFIVDPNGFVVTGTGTVNAGLLTVSTSRSDFADDLVAEINSGGGSVAQLFAGTEPLSGAEIRVDAGGTINATGLELRSGLQLILDGVVTVTDPTAVAGSPGVAVNTDGRPQATGVSVANGVIRFGATNGVDIGGQVTAQRGTSGGAIVSESGDLRLKTGAVLDVTGGAEDAGTIVLFTDGSAILEEGIRLDTTSFAGAGGFGFVKALGDLKTESGDGSAITLAGGATLLEGENVALDHTIKSAGGDLSVIGLGSVAIGAGTYIETDGPVAGDLIVSSPGITVGSGARLSAEGTTAGGLIGLIAHSAEGGGIWSVSSVGANAGVTIADATISGGSVVVSSAASTMNMIRVADVAAAESQNDENLLEIDAALNSAKTLAQEALTEKLLELDAKQPLKIKTLDSTATVRVTGASITADGTWTNPNGLTAAAGTADNGVLSADGFGLVGYDVFGWTELDRKVVLPSQFDAAATDVFVQAAAETVIDIDVGDKALSATVARTERAAAVIFEDTTINSGAGVVLNSVTQDTLDVTTAARDVEGKAFGLTYTTSDTRNQVVVNGGSVTAPDVAIQALTGKTQSTTNAVRSATGAKGAAAVTVTMNLNTTEALVNTTVTSDTLLVNAETLYFALNRTTNATVGVNEGLAETDQTTQRVAADYGEAFGDDVNGEASGDTADAPTGGTNYGLAVDVQLDRDVTRAVIGAAPTDLALAPGITSTDSATINLTGDLNLTATHRFARTDEGGTPLKRNVHAILGDIPDGASSNFAATSLMSLNGAVTAELGSGATVDAAAANVAALTSIGDITGAADSRNKISAFIDDVAGSSLLDGSDAEEIAQLPTPSELLNDPGFLTTSTGVRTLVQDGEDQASAKGAGVTVANLNTTTTAVIRDGAVVTTAAALNLTARTEGVFFHDSPNSAAAAEVAGETPGTPGNVIGGSLNFARTNADTIAAVDGSAKLNTGDLNVLADTALIQLSRTEGGGAGDSKAINAAFAVNVVGTKTFARVGELVGLDAANIQIAATDASQVVAVAGSETESAGRAAGAGVAVNIINRDTRAALGESTATPGAAVTADSLRVAAANTGVALAAGIAATRTSGDLASPPSDDNTTDTASPGHLLTADENNRLNAQADTTTRANQSGGTQRSGWAVSGAAALNIMTRDDATAQVVKDSTVDLTGGALEIAATSSASTLAIGGAVFRGMAPASKSTGLAGAFALNFDTNGRNTEAVLEGATVTAGSVVITARDVADNIAVAAGGGGKTKPGAAVAGSVALVNETGFTRATVADAELIVTGAMTITSVNEARLMALGGAAGASLSLKGAGIGAGVAVVTTERDADVRVGDGVVLKANAATLTSDATLRIVSIAASVAAGRRGVSGGVAANTVAGDSRVLIGTGAGSGATLAADDLTLAARDNNTIWTLSGAVGAGKTGAVGAGLSVNTVTTTTELAVLNSTVTGPATVVLASEGLSAIKSRAAAGAASTATTAAVGATVNTVSADTLTRFDGSTVSADTATFTARNARVIQSRAGGAAATSAAAAGLALAANTLAGNDTRVSLNGAQITTTGDVTATATTASQIDSKAAGLTFGNGNSGAASTAVGVIETQTRVQAAGAQLTAGGAVNLTAKKTSSVDVWAGSIALSGSGNAVGGAVAVNVLRDTVTADVATTANITATALDVTATNEASITAGSLAGAVTGGAAVTGSLVYSQIGAKPSGAISVGGAVAEPATDGAADTESARDAALADVTAQTGVTYALDQDDLTRARVEMGGGSVSVGALNIEADETSRIDTNAGGFSVSGSNAGGASVNTAVLYGKVEATLDIAEETTVDLTAPVSVVASQNGVVEMDARAGSAGRSYAGAGSLIVGIFDRKVDAQIAGFDGNDLGTDVTGATLKVIGSNVTVKATQAGSLNTDAGAATAGGSGAAGGAVIFSRIADDATATLRGVTIDQGLSTAGALSVAAENLLEVDQDSMGFGFSSNLAFAGSFGVTVIDTDTITRLQRARVDAGSAVIAANLENTLSTDALSAAAGKTAGAFAVISNTSDGRVLTDIDQSDVRTYTSLTATADATVTVNASASSGAAAASGSLSGSVLSNDIGNRAETILRNSGGDTASRLLSRGTTAVLSTARATYNLVGGNLSAGNASFGGTVVTTLSRNQALTTLRDNASVDGLGYAALVTRLGTQQGVVLDSFAESALNLTSVTAAVAPGFSGAAAVAYNTTSDTALTSVGQNTEAAVNGLQDNLAGAAFFAPFGVTGPANEQDSIVNASTDNTANVLVSTNAASGSASVGAAASTSLVTSRAEVDVNLGLIGARRNVDIDATSLTKIAPDTIGIAAASAGVAASLTYSEVASRALVTLKGAAITAGADLSINAIADNTVMPRTGNFTVGKAAGAGSFNVTKFASQALVTTSNVNATRVLLSGDVSAPVLKVETVDVDTELTATGALDIGSLARNSLDGASAAGAAGGGALSFAANIAMVESQSGVIVGEGQSLTGGTVAMTADEETDLLGQVGAGAAAGIGFGGSLDYLKFGGDSNVLIGNNATVTADGAIVVSAEATRDVKSRIGVAAIGSGTVAAAVSLIDLGGSSANLNADASGMLGTVNTSLGGSEAGAGNLAASANVASAGATALSARNGTNVAAVLADDVGVAINNGATLRGRSIAIDGQIAAAIDQDVGVATASAAGLSASVGAVSLNSNVSVATGNGTALLADDAVSLTARTAGLNGANAVDSRVANLAVSALASGAAGLSFVDNNASAAVRLNGATTITGNVNDRAGAVSLTAERTERVTGETMNVTLSAGGGIGVSRVELRNDGLTNVDLTGGAVVRGTSVAVTAQDQTTAAATAIGATGGLLLAGSGVETDATSIGESRVRLAGADITAYTVDIENTSRATVTANSTGVTIGSVAVGVTISKAEFGATVVTDIQDTTIFANTLEMNTGVDAQQGANAQAKSFAATGGLAAGAGTFATATTAYDVLTQIDGTSNLTGRDIVRLGSRATGVTARADATGVTVGGAIAVGVVETNAGQIGARNASVRTLIKQGNIASFGDVVLFADNTQIVDVNTIAGSGGVVSGTGSIANTDVNATTTITTGSVPADAATGAVAIAGGPVNLTAGNPTEPTQTDATLVVRATQDTTLKSDLDNTNASLIGVSGGKVNGTLDFVTNVNIGGGTLAQGNRMDIGATHVVSRPADGFNIRSNSGGAFDGASIDAELSLHADTNVTFEDNSRLQQLGDLDFYQSILIGITTDTTLVDRIKLDAGGGLALPLGRTVVNVNRNVANVTFKDTEIDAIGPLKVYTGSSADVRTEAYATSYGLAGSASATTGSTYNAENKIIIGAGADLESRYDISLRAGYGRNSLQDIAVNAESRVFNKTVIPVTLPPTADALANTTSLVEIADGAKVYAYQDVFVEAADGARQVKGYGLAKDFYLEILAAVANAVGGAFGLDPVVLDIRRGNSTDNAANSITVNGELRAGAYSRRRLALDASLNDTSDAAGSRAEVFFDVRRGVSTAESLRARLDAINLRLADPSLSSDPSDPDRVVLETTRDNLQTALATAETDGLVNDVVNVRPLWAAEGSITLLADTLQGNGDLSASGDVLVDITSEAGATLVIEGIAVSRNQGGQITFNNRLIASNAEIAGISEGGTQDFDIDFVNGTGDNQINIITNAPPAGVPSGRDGTIDIVGDVTNDRGDILIASNKGSASIRAAVAGVDITVSAALDIEAVIEGLFRAGGDPARGYQDLFDGSAWGAARSIFRPSGETTPTIVSFSPRATNSGITAGRNVNLIATTININSTIKAGTGTYDVIIGSKDDDSNTGINAEINRLRASNGSGRELIYDSAAFPLPNTVKSPNIGSNTNVNIFYNHDTDQIEVDDMLVRGGQVSITGNIISTGTGRIEALDGQGALNLVSYADADVVLKSVDLGGTPGGAGLAGVVRITDTAKRTTDGRILTTEFRRLGDTVTQVSNETIRIDTDPLLGSVEVPTFLVSETTGRSANYDPLANRDYVVRQTTQYDAVMDQTYQYYVEGDWTFISTKKAEFPLYWRREATAGTTYLQDAPSVEASIGSTDYSYRFESSARPGFLDADGNLVPTTPPIPVASADRFNNDLLPIISNVYESHSGGVHLITRQRRTEYTEVEIETHRLKADYPVEIFFSGSDTSSFEIQTKGNVILSEAIVNGAGPSNITSTNGSILTAGNSVSLTTQDLKLTAENGAIEGLGGAFQIDLINNGELTAIAKTGIDVFELSGDLNLGDVATSARDGTGQTLRTGQVKLTAQGSILQSDPAALLAGSDITLEALEGAVGGGNGNRLRIDTADDGVLNITARDDIDVVEIAGDLGLGAVTSLGGSVTLDVPTGSLLDRNDLQDRDIRTLDQLKDLWDTELGLTSDSALAAERYDAQVASLKVQREADYQFYWDKRAANGGAPVTFVLSEKERDALTLPDPADTRLIDQRIAEMTALYETWNAGADFDPNYSYAVSAAEADAVTEGYLWTTQELTRSIQDGTIARIGDTDLDDESPNISANQNITVRALNVGEVLEPYEVASGGTLTDRDFEVLATAGPGDVTIIGDTTFIRQEQDLDFAFDVGADGNSLGVLRVIASDQDIYLGAETAAQLGNVDASNQVQIRVNGLLTDARDGQFAVNGRILTLEAGNDGSIGSAVDPLTVNIDPDGSLTARAGGDVHIAAPTTDLPLETIFAGGAVSLRTPGAITDVNGLDTPRVLAGDISLTAGTIGTDSTPLGLGQTSATDGGVDLTTTVAALNVKGYGDLSLRNLTSATGGRFDLTGTSLLGLVGNDTIQFDRNSTFTLTTDNGLASTASTGTDITGGTLVVLTDAAWGSDATRVTTDIATLSYSTGNDARDPSLYLAEVDDLFLGTFNMGSAGTVADLVVGGALTGALRSAGLVNLTAHSMDITTLTADKLTADTVGTLRLRDAQVDGRAGISAGTALTVDVAVADTFDLVSGTTLSFGSVTAANMATLNSGTALSGSTLLADIVEADAGTDLTLDDAQAATRMTLNAGGDLTGRLLDAATFDAFSGGTTTIDQLTAAQIATLIAGGAANLTDLAAGRADIMADGAVNVGRASLTDGLEVLAGTTLTFGDVVAATDVTLESGTALAGTSLRATDLVALAGTDLVLGLGMTGTSDLTAGGDLTATLDTLFVDAATTVGVLDLSLVGRNGRVGTVQTESGSLALTSDTAVTTAGLIRTETGWLTATFAGDLTQLDDSVIGSDAGLVSVSVAGDLAANRVETGGAALSLTVDGALRAVDPNEEVISANTSGSVTTLTLGASPEMSETGLRINVDTLRATVAQGDLHLLESDGLRAENVKALAGDIDLNSRGTLDVGTVAGQTVTLTSGLDLTGAGAVITADTINLLAFGGAITGPDGAFDAETSDGAVLVMNAQTDLVFAERAGNLRVAVANAARGDLTIRNNDPVGMIDVGALGSGGTMTLTSNGDLTLNVIGGGQIDMIDEVALALIDRSDPRYGLTNLSTPRALVLTANGAGSTISLRLGQARERVVLTAANVNANLHDVTPSDGLDLVVGSPEHGFAAVDIQTVADGFNGLITDPFGLDDVTVDLEKTFDAGLLRVVDSRISGGEITHLGDVLSVAATRVSGDAWLRQRENDVLATVEFRELVPEAEIQILALDHLSDGSVLPGAIEFLLAEDGTLVTSNKLVLSRDIDVLVVNAAPGELTGVLIDQLQILTTGPRFDSAGFGRTNQLEKLLLPELLEEGVRGEVISLPFTLASLQ